MDSKSRQRMVVEEVPQISDEAASDIQQPLEEIKKGVEELQDITEHMSQDVKESAQVQEEIVEAAEKVEPTFHETTPVLPVSPKSSAGVNPLVIIIPGVLLLGALLGGIVFYQKNTNSTIDESPVPTEVPVVSVAPSATPVATVDLTKYSVVIFNGSGIPGEAGKAKTLLTTAGFKVGSTSNAATYDYTKTIIKAKSTVDAAFVTKLSETLGKNYIVDKSQVLDSTSKNDVEVVVGSSKN